jgi:hypothetical protein
MTVIDGVGASWDKEFLPELNRDLLESTVRWAMGLDHRAKDPSWEQSTWGCIGDETKIFDNMEENICGSFFCIAGKAVLDSGGAEILDLNEEDDYPSAAPFYSWTVTKEYIEKFDVPTNSEAWWVVGAGVLGLTHTEASRLFAGDNDLEEVIRISENIATSRGMSLDLG